MKITKTTVIKLIAAAIVPGGFIIWGLDEIVKRYRKRDKKVYPDSDKAEPDKVD